MNVSTMIAPAGSTCMPNFSVLVDGPSPDTERRAYSCLDPHSLFLVTVLLMLAPLMPARLAAGESFRLAADGTATAVIIHNGHESAAKTLATYLEQIAGTPFQAVPDKAALPAGRLPVTLHLVDTVPGASARATAEQAYRIVATADRAALTAATPQGLEYAVYGLLEDHLGCRFYTPDVEVIPARTTLELPPLDEVSEPGLQIRGFIYYPHVFKTGWVRKNRGGGLPADEIASSHTFYNYLPPDKHFKEHPEWYPLIKGKRTKTWSMAFCYSNPEMAKAFAEAVKKKMAARAASTPEERRKKRSLDPANPLQIGQGDGFTACACATCRALVAQEGTEAAPVILMMNRVLEETTKEYPDQGICTFAYFGTLTPPKTLVPHERLWINVVSSAIAPGPSGDQLGPIRDNIHNRDYAAALEGWPKIAPGRVTTWEWSHWGPYYWPNLYNSVDSIRYWHAIGITGGQFQVGWGEGNFAWLRNWLYLKLMWNPKADEDALIRDFLAGTYGPRAAPLMWQFIQLAEKNGRDSGYAACLARWNYWPATLGQKLYPDAVAERMDQILELAERAAEEEDDPAYAHRIAAARSSAVDRILLDKLGPLARTPELEDGETWFVPEGGLDAVARLRRGLGVIARGRQWPGANHERSTAKLVGKLGGPILSVESDALRLELVPNLQVRPISLVHKPTGKELLCFSGAPAYRETVRRHIWCLRRAEVEGTTIRTVAHLEAGKWKWSREQLIKQDFSLTDDGGLALDRNYFITHGTPLNGRFGMAWNLYLPDPAAARVVVRGGGVEKAFAPSTAARTGVSGAVKEDENRKRRDFMDPLLDAVEPVQDAEETILPLTGEGGDVEVKLIRGDGLALRLTVPVAGTKAVRLKPVVDENRLEVTFVGHPIKIGKASRSKPFTADLPGLTLQVEAADTTPTIHTRTNPKDGAELVWIPAGSFLRGSNAAVSQRGERPQRPIHLDGYWIYKTPVTAAMYAKYCQATGQTLPKEFWGKALEGDTPMLGLNWYKAAAYAKWAGAALPTEAQWEKAARGTDGRVYPWGSTWDPEACWNQMNSLYEGPRSPSPVGTRPQGASPWGVLDMAGNCWEFVRDWYSDKAHATGTALNPEGPATGTHKVLKGGSWQWDRTYLRSAYREANPPHIDNWLWVGFRCVVEE